MSGMRSLRPRDAERGFTLIEMLAALAIGSVVLAATATLIHNVALNFDRGTGLAGKTDQLLLAAERLAADFGSARQVPQSRGDSDAIAFAGGPTQVRFVANGRTVPGRQGDDVVALTVEDSDGASHLVRRRAPWPGSWLGPQTSFEGANLGDPVDLIEGRVDIAFSFGSFAPDGSLTWSNTWREQQLLPRFVQLKITDRVSGADLLPGLQFVLRADAPIGCAEPGANTGCLTGGSQPQSAPAKDPSSNHPPGARG